MLLPVGFAAGALVDELDPHRRLGPAFSPLVSLAVAVILYDAGLGLDLRKLKGHVRRVVIGLIWIGVLITWVFGTLLAMPLLGMDRRAAVMLGAILVVSGPTVVGPLLSFVRPKERPQHILVWEGSLIDPVGGILGALVFHFVEASTGRHVVSEALNFLGSVGVGMAGGITGTALLWVLFRRLRPGEVLFGTELTGVALPRRYEDGASMVTRPADQAVPAGCDMLFLIRGDGRLDPVTEGSRPLPGPGDLGSFVWIRLDQGAGSGACSCKAEEGAHAERRR
ncbi:cation:proton antiporter, partial [Streptomyces sp. NPDC051664]|uniref:cation:proton antiporter domain-containing protein n=1 Tax=Streptomyces sp. NPDC051664 TaxID=3365668 RepID=UPI00379FC0DC